VDVAICRTDYPGTESETVAMNAVAGQTEQLTCPDATDYYMWNNMFTSAQYYVNPKGVPTSIACQWQNSDTPGDWYGSPGNVGNWSPVILGVGKGPTGETFISIFQNAPTNPSGILDFNIKITGGVSGDCKYEKGKYYNNGVVSPTGCTVSLGNKKGVNILLIIIGLCVWRGNFCLLLGAKGSNIWRIIQYKRLVILGTLCTYIFLINRSG
jgi:hypothetical protein